MLSLLGLYSWWDDKGGTGLEEAFACWMSWFCVLGWEEFLVRYVDYDLSIMIHQEMRLVGFKVLGSLRYLGLCSKHSY